MSDKISGGGSGKNVTGKRSEEKKEEGVVHIPAFPSQYIFHGRSTCEAPIRIVDISGGSSRGMANLRADLPNQYPSVLDLLRRPGFGYHIIIRPGFDEKNCFKESLRQLQRVMEETKVGPNTMTLSFGTSHHSKHYTIEFNFSQHFEYYKKYFTEFLKLLQDTTGAKHDKIDEWKKKKIVNGYHVFIDTEEQIKKKKKKGFLNKLSQSILESTRHPQFYHKPYEAWGHIEKINWLKHIPYQDTVGSEVKNVYIVLEERDLLTPIHEYFIMIEEATIESLLREIQCYETSESYDQRLSRFMYVDRLRKRVKMECEMVIENGHKFNMAFFYVLTKQIKNQGQQEPLLLHRVLDVLLGHGRYYWDVEDCRDYILFLLLYKEKLREFINRKKTQFEKLESKKVQEKKVIELDPDDWDELLRQFNTKIQCDFHFLEYRVWIKYERNEYRKELLSKKRDYDLLKIQEKEIEERIWKIGEQIKSFITEAETDRKVLAQLALTFDPNNSKNETSIREEKYEKRVKESEEKVYKLRQDTRQLTDTQKRIGEAKETLKSEFDSLKREILNCTPLKKVDQKRKFFCSKRRRETVRKMIVQKIDQLSSRVGNLNQPSFSSPDDDDNISELGVKLVISMFEGFHTSLWMKKSADIVDKVLKPNFYRWGFTHPNILIANLGIHWFASALVGFRNLSANSNYKEIVALDTGCTIFFNKKTIFEVATSLAEYIVSCNINNKYVFYDIWDTKHKMNCQEFTIQILEKLDHSSDRFFFPVVQSYLDDLRSILSKMDRHSSTDKLRFVPLSSVSKYKEFIKKFKTVFVKKGKWCPDKKKRVYFKTHRSVDEFYMACREIDVKFRLHYPGIFQLLKGFDRAFWIQKDDLLNLNSKNVENVSGVSSGHPSGGSSRSIKVNVNHHQHHGEEEEEFNLQELQMQMEEWYNCPFADEGQVKGIKDHVHRLLRKNEDEKKKVEEVEGEEEEEKM